MRWLSELNPEQQKAATAADGPLLIMAGPGTGKTKTLTARITYLLASGRATADEVLALTFTNKAAEEMRTRVAALLPAKTLPNIFTFHGLCHKLLSRGGKTIKFISEHERNLLIKELRKSAEPKTLTTRELALEFSRLKNLPPSTSFQDQALGGLLKLYNRVLKERGLHDFDDLLQKTHQLLQKNPPSQPYKYILVDEFQDTNAMQYELLQLLRSSGNVCVIGDPLQSIYGFRGANSDVFERFRADFPAAQQVTLRANYRSAPQVVALANTIFLAAPALHAQSKKVGQVRAVEVLNEYGEAAWIVNQIEQAIGGSDLLRSHALGHGNPTKPRAFRDFAILYRTHHASRAVRRTLAESGLPFQVVGEGSPYEEPAVVAVMHVLAYLNEPNNEREAALDSLLALKRFSHTRRRALLEELEAHSGKKLSELATLITKIFGLEQPNFSQFLSTLIRFDELGLSAYVKYVDSLKEGNFYDPKADAVTLMTIHAAKGLEFTHVFVIAVEEGSLPHQRPNKPANTEEERRLFYVAATRACEQLDLLYAKNRAGQKKKPSRFITDIHPNILSRTQDETMAAQQHRLTKRQQKRRQATLFDA